MISDLWGKISNTPLADGYTFKKSKTPRTGMDTMERCRALCKQNICGQYDTNWSCPPGVGTERECLERIRFFKNAAVIYRRYDIDPDNKTKVKKISSDHQELCRQFVGLLRKEGYQAIALADGGCSYCSTCSYPDEPCKFPEQKVMSLVSYGIMMMEYLESLSLDFTLDKDAVTLYGLILYNEPIDK
jgi:predicted metal-binding protein